MNPNQRVRPSDQVDSFLPNFINENYRTFVEFMTTAFEAEERIGFSQDLLQNLDLYRDFDTYKADIIDHTILTENVDLEQDEIQIHDGTGFPERDGVVLIGEEVMLYRLKEGNTLTGVLRGAPGATRLPSYIKPGEYLDSVPRLHAAGDRVENLSVLVLSSFLETIHNTYSEGIISTNVNQQVNRSTLLQRIKDFFQSKGTKLGIQSLFKILFADKDVDVKYPGDLMLKASDSTFDESLVVRTVPVSPLLSGIDVLERYELPDKVLGQNMRLYSYNDDKVYARVSCDYVTSYPIESEVQYDITIDKEKVIGEVLVNPSTPLTRELEIPGTVTNNLQDVFTVTVQSTAGFPSRGYLIVNDEAIYYGSKSFNQFLDCRRGAIGVPAVHSIGEIVYGPYYLESEREENGLVYKTRSFPTGLVKQVNVVDGGLFYKTTDNIHLDKPGKDDPREQILSSIQENYNYDLVRQYSSTEMEHVGNYAAGVSGVYFDDNIVYISSTNLPYYSIGPFSTDKSVGLQISAQEIVHAIPRRHEIQTLEYKVKKGNTRLGTFVDGVSAISCNSFNSVTQGKIVRFDVVSHGEGYENPTVLIEPNNSQAKAIVDKGRVVAVEATSAGNYDFTPIVRVSSGDGAKVMLAFDPFGRITNVTVLDRGQHYEDVPTIELVDETGVGRGGQLRANVSGGELISVDIISSGIDYSLGTFANVISVGFGAEVAAVVESYTFDRFREVLDTPNWQFDKGNGFLYENVNKTRNLFGYVCSPTELRRDLNDDGTKHSPIIGWAYDGNPIYGPYGYVNSEDDKLGVERQRSGYVLNNSRAQTIPNEGDGYTPGLNPPSETEYPMGSFINDYTYKGRITFTSDQLTTETDEDIQNEVYAGIEAESRGSALKNAADTSTGNLDSFNGKFCNTPDFPKELYPDGVYCYFVTVDGSGVPQYPYIIGESFNNAPMSQRIKVDSSTGQTFGNLEFNPESFDDTQLTLDFSQVERYRHPYISTSASELDLTIQSTQPGSVSEFHYKAVTGSKNKMVGDLTYISTVMSNGGGALGIVTDLTGEPVVKNENNWIQSRIVSHRQEINLSNNTYDSFVFVRGTKIRTTSDAVAIVRSYDPVAKLLEVQTITPNLIQAGDVFLDNRNAIAVTTNRNIEMTNNIRNVSQFTISTEDGTPVDDENVLYVAIKPEEKTGVIPEHNMVISGYFAPVQRPDGNPIIEGDLWWSNRNGRMYVYYNQPLNDMWVCTQPLGMIPLNGSSDEGWGNDTASGNAVYHETANYTLTISEKAPTQRGDGSPLAIGDLWWSPHTGGLFLWHSDQITYYTEQFALTGEIPEGAVPETYNTTREWVCVDPLAVVPQGNHASDDFFPYPDNLRATFSDEDGIFVEDINVIVSARAPSLMPDGSAVTVGTLWWSNANGKMYIYFNSPSGNVWVVTNPSSSLGFGPYTIDGLPWEGGEIILPPGGELPEIPGGLDVLPELEDQDILWVLDYDQFIVGDSYEIVLNSDPTNNEIVTLYEKGTYDSTNSEIKVIRGVDPSTVRGSINTSEIPDLTIIKNLNHSIYEVWADKDHHMLVGDKVTISGSSIPQVNGEHTISKVGTVRKAILRSRINASGTVSDVFIDDPGFGYESDFYVEVVGDGIGAQLIAHVETFEMGGTGQVTSVDIISGGIGYTEAPELIATPASGQYARDYFAFIVDGLRGTESNRITYTTKSETVVSDIAKVSVKAHGSGYLELPPVDGFIKKIDDRAKGMPYLNGTSIAGVDMLLTGSRYEHPVPVFSDLFGTGTGALGTCILQDDLIVGVNIIRGGENYVEPVVEFVEMDDIIYADSNDIGAITSIKVLSPGRNIPSDLSIRPEVEIEARLLIELDDRLTPFDEGERIYQGTDSYKTAEATVVRYDALNHTLLIDDIRGIFRKGEKIGSLAGTKAMVKNVKQAKTNIDVSGSALQEGRFIDEKSFVSSFYSVLQDSYYYQYFSYVISSQIEETRYINFVNTLTHPAGFALFTDIEINEGIETLLTVQPMDLDGNIQIVDVAGIEGDDSQVLASDNRTSAKQVIGWDDK